MEKTHPYLMFENYLVHTVTNYYVGQLTAVYDQELVLSDASWVQDTGRFSKVFTEGLERQASSEIEYTGGDIIVGRGAIVNAEIYPFPLPKAVK